MIRRPRLLDLFCGAGGCGVGYARAGFDVVGVDAAPQKRYPFAFHQADALDFLRLHGAEFDAIHASPPCQKYSSARFCRPGRKEPPDLVPPTRKLLEDLGRPWVIENVMGAPLSRFSCMLCGLMFGLKVFRHRLFESSHLLFAPPHPSHKGKRIGRDGYCCVAGHGDASYRYRKNREEAQVRVPGIPTDHRTVAAWKRAMGIDWMIQSELAQAIPPAYTSFLGHQVRAVLGG